MVETDESLNIYAARIDSVYDGDTFTATIKLGFNCLIQNAKIRLYGVDTPEVRGDEKEEGVKVRDIVRDLILGQDIILLYEGKGKYGRFLCRVVSDRIKGGDLSSFLLLNQYAKPYE